MGTLEAAFIGTYPPTQCGLATFTAALRNAMAPGLDITRSPVVRVVDQPDGRRPREVAFEWCRGDQAGPDQVRAVLASADIGVIQHEYGIFDGRDGAAIVDVMRDAPVPLIVVLHTVLAEPSRSQQRILEAVCESAAAVVTQSHAARQRLFQRFAVEAGKIHVIPHGAAPNLTVDDGDPAPSRRREQVVLTWGLIGPGKGLEHAIDAIAELSDLDPAPRYVIAGQTHPKVRAAQGETYREGLRARALSLRVAERVHFDDRYRSVEELNALIRTADIVLLPYESRDQVTSGVLVEALASGKPVVATAFPHAREALASGAGRLVPHDNPVAMAEAIRALVVDPALAAAARASAAQAGRSLFWPEVGRRYLDLAVLTASEYEPRDRRALQASG